MNLADYLDSPTEGEFLDGEHALDIMTAVAVSLSAHEANGARGVDLHPMNIHLCEDGSRLRVYLYDLGKIRFRGTPWWTAPETYAGAPGPSAPLFSFGLVAFTLLSKRPFLQFVRDWTGERHPVWPETLERFLSVSPSPFEEAIFRAPREVWRQTNGGGILRLRILSLLFAATRYAPGVRTDELVRILGPAAEFYPAAACVAWLRNLRGMIEHRVLAAAPAA